MTRRHQSPTEPNHKKRPPAGKVPGAARSHTLTECALSTHRGRSRCVAETHGIRAGCTPGAEIPQPSSMMSLTHQLGQVIDRGSVVVVIAAPLPQP